MPVVACLMLFAALAGSSPVQLAGPTQRMQVFVGPAARDGFVDIDGGILDSIKDIQNELRRSKLFAVTDTREGATLVLIVERRRVSGNAGGVAMPIGTSAVVIPIDRHAIDTTLHFGTHEKAFTSDDNGNGTWRHAARQVAKDLTVWVTANREAIAKLDQ
jgi:hypothetical protein